MTPVIRHRLVRKQGANTPYCGADGAKHFTNAWPRVTCKRCLRLRAFAATRRAHRTGKSSV